MYLREASALDLFTDSIRLMGDATLCGVMEFDRRIDAGALEQAAQACLLAHPILHSRLVRGNGPAFWEMTEHARIPPVEVIPCNGDYRPLVTGPVDPYGPVQFRVRLLRQQSGDVIVVNLAHAAADAYGLHALMSQLLQEYATPGSIRPAKGGIPERDTLWTRKLDKKEHCEIPEMGLIDPLWPDPFGTSDQPVTYHRETISPPDLEAIRREVKSLGGSVNDAILAAYYLTMSDITGHYEPMSLYFPVNLRQHKNDGSRVMSNQATNVCIAAGRQPGDGMEEILPAIIGQTTRLKADNIGIAEQVKMDAANDPEGHNVHQMVEEMAAKQNAGLADIFISNPGPVTLPGAEGLTGAYVCYPGGYMPTTCFVTSTFRGQMTITMGYQDSVRPREGTKKAMAQFRHHLLSLVDGSQKT